MDDRRDDWRHGVDENLASLNASMRVYEKETESIFKMWSEIDAILRGDPKSEISGVISRLEAIERDLSKINAVLFVDPTGKKGLVHDFEALKDGREDRRTQWGNWTKIVVAVITSGALGLFWRDIRAFLSKPSTDPMAQIVQKATHPKSRHRHYTIQAPSNEPETE